MRNIKIELAQYYLDLKYNCQNNMLLLFIYDNIIQINVNTKEITTIYIIDFPNLLHKSQINDNAYEPFKIYSFHNYNKKLKNMEQIILLKENRTNKIYPYLWEDNSLLFTQEFEFPDFIAIDEFDIFYNIGKSAINNVNESPYKIFIASDKIILFK